MKRYLTKNTLTLVIIIYLFGLIPILVMSEIHYFDVKEFPRSLIAANYTVANIIQARVALNEEEKMRSLFFKEKWDPYLKRTRARIIFQKIQNEDLKK